MELLAGVASQSLNSRCAQALSGDGIALLGLGTHGVAVALSAAGPDVSESVLAPRTGPTKDQ